MRSFAFPSFAAVRGIGSLWQGQANATAAEPAALETIGATADALKAAGVQQAVQAAAMAVVASKRAVIVSVGVSARRLRVSQVCSWWRRMREFSPDCQCR